MDNPLMNHDESGLSKRQQTEEATKPNSVSLSIGKSF